MIRTVYDNNAFAFGDKRYIQKKGVAIGPSLGKIAYTCAMCKWHGLMLWFRAFPYFYRWRFTIWTEGVEELKLFDDQDRSSCLTIQVELRYDRTQT